MHGDWGDAVWNGRFQSKRLHPLFVFNRFGNRERCALRPGNVHGAEGREDVLKPVLARYPAEARPSVERRRFRADAAFAIPTLFELLEIEGRDDAISIKGNPRLHEQIAGLMKCRPGRPSNHVVRQYTSFHYRARSRPKARRGVARMVFPPGDVVPRGGFIITNQGLPNKRVLTFHNQRGGAGHHMKEGKYALKWARIKRGREPIAPVRALSQPQSTRRTTRLSLQVVCVHVMFFVKSERWIDMDHKQFQGKRPVLVL